MKVLVIASHSGGHISPAIAFCQGLKDKNSNVEINFVTTYGQIEKKLLNNKFKLIYFKKEKITFLNSYKLFRLIFKANSLLKITKPDLVVGFGGYLSIPFIICAYFQKVPNFIQEQNITLGKANRFLIGFTDRLILSFPNSELTEKFNDKALVLGPPLRKELTRLDKKLAKTYFGFEVESFTILVIGGSQGASKINSEVIKALKDKALYDVSIIHIVGFLNYEGIIKDYKDIKIKHRIFSFMERMDYAFSACDIVISRAGASVLAEIISLSAPSILVPYPYAKHHQLDNARFLSEKEAAILIEDKFFNADIIKEKILDLKNNPNKLEKISESLKVLNISDSRNRLAEFAFKLSECN